MRWNTITQIVFFMYLLLSYGCTDNRNERQHPIYEMQFDVQYLISSKKEIQTEEVYGRIGKPDVIIRVSELPGFFLENFCRTQEETEYELLNICYSYKKTMRSKTSNMCECSSWETCEDFLACDLWIYDYFEGTPVKLGGILPKFASGYASHWFLVEGDEIVATGTVGRSKDCYPVLRKNPSDSQSQ